MAAGELDELVTSFKAIAVKDVKNASVEVIPFLEKLVTSTEANAKAFSTVEFTSEFLQLLTKADSSALKEQIGRTIAEVTKIDAQRKRFTNTAIIEELLKHLSVVSMCRGSNGHGSSGDAKSLSDEQLKVAIQSCRALGNICYNNEDARNLILKIDGDRQIVDLLDVKLSAANQLEVTFGKFRGGLISNYLLGGEHLAKHAIELNILGKIEAIIDDCSADIERNEEILLSTLQPLSLLTENVADLNFSQKLNSQLVRILAASKHPDVAEICLEMLNYQAETDDVKFQLAKDGVCETIYRLLETYKTLANTSEARALMKLACDLIILILTGDESMHYLYKTPLLKYMEDWLDSYDVDLLTTGVLALGNFARTDSHCIEMVERNVTTKLLAILSQNNGVDGEMRLQHALLSALRNLVIPKQNKPIIIKAGLVQTILPMLEIHEPPVVYKLLGTLRMIIDGQVGLAHELLQNAHLIKQLVQWCKSSDCSSVTGESYRLMAWLIKHAYKETSTSPTSATTTTTTTTTATATNAPAPLIANANPTSLKAFIEVDGAVASMVTMLTSQHLVMQNEALIALSIIALMFMKTVDASDPNLAKLLIECDLGVKLTEFIGRSADSMTKEIVENVQTLIALLRTSDMLVKHLNDHNIDELLKTIPILTVYCTL